MEILINKLSGQLNWKQEKRVPQNAPITSHFLDFFGGTEEVAPQLFRSLITTGSEFLFFKLIQSVLVRTTFF